MNAGSLAQVKHPTEIIEVIDDSRWAEAAIVLSNGVTGTHQLEQLLTHQCRYSRINCLNAWLSRRFKNPKLRTEGHRSVLHRTLWVLYFRFPGRRKFPFRFNSS